jgi:serine/threonine protein kinase/tetratricopeptide (TPR) repeat protein
MVAARWETIKTIFDAALLVEPREWPAFLAHECGTDTTLAQEVMQLLVVDRENSSFLEVPAYEMGGFAAGAEKEDAFEPHQILSDRFEILRLLGEGGMGQVYEAFDLELRESVAIKAIRRDIANRPGVLERFKGEVFSTRKVTHSNVCRTFDLGTHTLLQDGVVHTTTFLTMELLRGETLAAYLQRERVVPIDDLRKIALQLAGALQAAHQVGIIHCDLKPANIFLTQTEDGLRAVVTDFGIAKLTRQNEDSSRVTPAAEPGRQGAVAGTPRYMAPEYAERGICTPRTDIYSLGLVLFEALTGERPQWNAGPTVNLQLSLDSGFALVDDSKSAASMWKTLLTGCLQRDPEERFQQVSEVLDLLTSPDRQSAGGWLGLRRSQVWIALASLAGVLTLAVWLESRGGPDEAPIGKIPSVAVLSFRNTNHDPALQQFSDGMAEDLTTDLSQVTGLRVRPYSQVTGTIAGGEFGQLGRRLGVDLILTGSLSGSANRVELKTLLVNTHTGAQLWGRTYVKTPAEMPELQQDIAEEVAFRVRTPTDGKLAQRLPDHTVLPASQAAYDQGQKALAEHTPAGWERAVSDFQQAIDADPQSAAAYAALANAYTVMANNYNRPEAPLTLMSNAEAAARRALQLDSRSVEAYCALARIKLLRDYDWDSAEEIYKRATQLDPDYLPAHTSYAALLLTAQARFAEAHAQFAYADKSKQKQLGIEVNEALATYYARHFDLSIEQAESIHQRFPDNDVVVEILAENYIALDEPKKVLRLLAKNSPKNGDVRISRDAMLGLAYARLGDKRKALQILRRMEDSKQLGVEQNFHLAALAAAVGDSSKALTYLERSYVRRQMSVLFLKVDPLMDPLRSDVRFQNLLVKLNLH